MNGVYCQQCGQKAVDDPTFGRWIAESFESLLDLESRSVQTMLLAIPRPGLVARRFVEGKRTRYVKPLRLFVVLSALVIPLMVVGGWFEANTQGQEEHAAALAFIYPALNFLSPFLAALIMKLFVWRIPLYHLLIMSLYLGVSLVVLGIPTIFVPAQPATQIYAIGLLFVLGFVTVKDFFEFGLLRTCLVAFGFVLVWQVVWQSSVAMAVGMVVAGGQS